MGELVRPRPLTKFCKKLRNSQTDAEKKLWAFLRKTTLGVKFRRQFAIGKYVVDFCCLEKKLILELDGGQHRQEKEKDDLRDKFLAQRGFKILRFWDDAVFERTKEVIEKIHKEISPSQPPPESTGEE